MFKPEAIKNRDVMVLAEELASSFPFLNVEYKTGKGYYISYDLDQEEFLVWPIGERPIPAQVAQAFLVGMKDAVSVTNQTKSAG